MTSREILSRRNFLQRATGAGLGLGAFSTLLDLRLLNSALAATDVADYKALVCLFLNGGNDGNNTLIPWDGARYDGPNGYKAVRGPRLAVWRDPDEAAARPGGAGNPNNYWGLPLTESAGGAPVYAVHSSMPEVQRLYGEGKLAFLAGTGVLVEPINRAQYRSKSRRRPPQLFSHNDQVTQWQTSIPDQISRTGWGGRSIDRMREELIRQGLPPGSISMSVSLAGSNTWEVGDVVNQFQVDTGGAVSITGYSGARQTLIDRILRHTSEGGDAELDAQRVNLHLRDFQRVNERALFNGASLATALTRLTAGQADAAYGGAIDAAFGIGNGVSYNSLSSLERQLHTIARIIAEREFLGMRRQIFFSSAGGYDTHGDQPVSHAGLLATLSRAMGKFHAAMEALGAGDKVTSFTASDFGRTCKSNGLGSDHAWSNHHLIAGGAVRGGRVYGTFPDLTLGGPDDTDGSNPTGRWIPTTSTDEYAATLAAWFGLGDAELDVVFPNLRRFSSRTLGFMA